jgi:hypothetical protein
MKYGVAEAARILQVEKDLIKTWAFKFSDYLNPKANPSKGQPREFTIDDIRVMAYIFTYWEENPDIEYIKIGLNSNNHYEDELIYDLLVETIPVFIEPPENMDETWKHGVLFGGLSQFGDQYFLANSYKLAGDNLINIALKNEEAWELFCPAVYNYRHAIELYMKDVIGYRKQTHDLLILFNKLESRLKTKFNTAIPDWFKNIIIAFNDFDPGGTAFRYGGNLNKDEVFIDFIQLKTLMERLSTSFKNIKKRKSQIIVHS